MKTDDDDNLYLLVVRPNDEGGVDAAPVMYRMGDDGATPLGPGDAPDDQDEFCDWVIEDMGRLLATMILKIRDGEMSKSEALLGLLGGMQDQPQELLHNMLATVIVGAAENFNIEDTEIENTEGR